VNIIPIAITKVMSTEKRFWTGHYSKPKKTTDSTTKPLITTLPGNARKAMEKLLPKGSAVKSRIWALGWILLPFRQDKQDAFYISFPLLDFPQPPKTKSAAPINTHHER
jgi:hypothetical protein